MTARVSDEDRGKAVVHETERIGVITDVRGETVYVDPVWNNVHDELRDEFGWHPGADHYTLEQSRVATVRNGQAHLRNVV